MRIGIYILIVIVVIIVIYSYYTGAFDETLNSIQRTFKKMSVDENKEPSYWESTKNSNINAWETGLQIKEVEQRIAARQGGFTSKNDKNRPLLYWTNDYGFSRSSWNNRVPSGGNTIAPLPGGVTYASKAIGSFIDDKRKFNDWVEFVSTDAGLNPEQKDYFKNIFSGYYGDIYRRWLHRLVDEDWSVIRNGSNMDIHRAILYQMTWDNRQVPTPKYVFKELDKVYSNINNEFYWQYPSHVHKHYKSKIK